jgi:hypothetical protein
LAVAKVDPAAAKVEVDLAVAKVDPAAALVIFFEAVAAVKALVSSFGPCVREVQEEEPFRTGWPKGPAAWA